MNKLLTFPAVAVIFISGLAGCALFEIKDQVGTLGNAGVIQGWVINKNNQKAPVIVVNYQKDKSVFVKNSNRSSRIMGNISSLLCLALIRWAYIDKNNNNKYDSDECGQFNLETSSVDLVPKQKTSCRFVNK